MTRSITLFAILFCLSAAVDTAATTSEGTIRIGSIGKSLPIALDWRDMDGVDYLPPVRSVGSCGSIYIFAPVGMVEARYRIAVANRGGALPEVDYSEQHIMACGSGYYGGFDCGGGYCKDILTHIRDNGVPDEACYLYTGIDAACPTGCPDSAGEMVLHWPIDEIGELTNFPTDEAIMQEIMDHGPVATTMDVYQDFYSYSSGVYQHITGNALGGTALMIVGWGEDGGTPFWICRNFWGPSWGDGGDFMVARNDQHANCDFGEWIWSCTIDTSGVANESKSWGAVKALYR